MFPLILLVFAFVLACIAAWTAPGPDPRYPRMLCGSLAFFFLACILENHVVMGAFTK